MNFLACYYAYREFYERKEFSITSLCAEEQNILHWARMNKIKRLDTDVWLIENYFDFANIMYTYHIENCEDLIFNYTLPIIVTFNDDEHWANTTKAQSRFNFTIEEAKMSIEKLKETWKNDEDGVWTKNGFTVTEDSGEIHVWFQNSEMNKPYSSLEQALYWCEGRMI